MPCYTPPPTEQEMNGWGELSPRQMEAVICGLISANGLDGVDWGEVGVPYQIVNRWWVKHQEEDRLRKQGGPNAR